MAQFANRLRWRILTRPRMVHFEWPSGTQADDRAAYVRLLSLAVKPGGHLIIGTFAENGPGKCSGLPVQRYSAQGLYSQFSAAFKLVKTTTEAHCTPSGSIQAFVYCWCRRRIE